jgi:hypothetical protein
MAQGVVALGGTALVLLAVAYAGHALGRQLTGGAVRRVERAVRKRVAGEAARRGLRFRPGDAHYSGTTAIAIDWNAGLLAAVGGGSIRFFAGPDIAGGRLSRRKVLGRTWHYVNIATRDAAEIAIAFADPGEAAAWLGRLEAFRRR